MEQEKLSKVKMVYFSGSGGTKRIADAFESELQKRQNAVEILNLGDVGSQENTEEVACSQVDFFILLFPVYAFDAPRLIFDWIETLGQDEGGKKITVISVSGGGEMWPNTGCRHNVCAKLEAKGMRIVYDGMMCMPANILMEVNDHLTMHLIRVIPEKVSKILDAVLTDQLYRTHCRKSTLRQFVTHMENKHAKGFTKILMITDDCNGCGWCAQNCPRSNITIDAESNKPVFRDRCTVCMRCVYGCPERAIQSKSKVVFKNGFDLNAVERRMTGVDLEPIEKCCKGIMFWGLKDYLSSKGKT